MFLLEDDMVECPYNSTHRMLRKRLQSHLLKCRKQYPDVELRKCPFNITHLIPEPEYANHATNCPDRNIITQYKYDAPERKEEEIPKHAPIECDENWDDTDVKDFNPRINLAKSNVLIKPGGTSRSERKLFIKQERKRLGDGDSSDDEREIAVRHRRQREEHYRNSRRSIYYHEEERGRYIRRKRSTSPSSSSHSRQRSRSPTARIRHRSRSPTVQIRHRSRSPTASLRDYCPSPPRHSLHRHSPPSYSHYHHSPPPYPYPPYYSLPSHSWAQYQYHSYDGRIANNDEYDNDRDSYYERNSEIPRVPSPPMISVPSPRSYTRSEYP